MPPLVQSNTRHTKRYYALARAQWAEDADTLVFRSVLDVETAMHAGEYDSLEALAGELSVVFLYARLYYEINSQLWTDSCTMTRVLNSEYKRIKYGNRMYQYRDAAKDIPRRYGRMLSAPIPVAEAAPLPALSSAAPNLPWCPRSC